ncbi:MAG TPA: inorganic diphosphatase [Pseudolabrys sp.]|nr:inorganic diphosphatase [Pseudolabrys sp.]
MQVFIENQAGSRRKNIYDVRTLRHLRTVDVSASYPYPYGFVIGTVSGDGDAVDCFVLTSEQFTAGTTLDCDPIGLLEQVEDGEVDHKVLAAPTGASVTIDDAVIAALKEFISRVFSHVPDKRMEIGRLLDRHAAESYLRQCRADVTNKT